MAVEDEKKMTRSYLSKSDKMSSSPDPSSAAATFCHHFSRDLNEALITPISIR
jgi:hypothetical protein